MILNIETARLALRPLSFSDRDAMVDTIMSDKDVMHWLPYAEAASTPRGQQDVAMGYLADFTAPWDEHGFGVWAVCIKDTVLGPLGTFIGYCGFLPEQIKGAGPEAAYAVGKSMWGKGVATEALSTGLEWIFTKPDICRVHAVTDEDNTASRHVLRKVGMHHEKDVDLYDSVAKGNGLLPFYTISRADYLKRNTAG